MPTRTRVDMQPEPRPMSGQDSTMPTIALLGASGYTGRLVAAELDRRGHDWIAAGRNLERVSAAVEGLAPAEVRRVDVDDQDAVTGLVADADLLLTTVGPFDALGRGVLAAAIENGAHYVDSTGEQAFIRWAFDRWGDVARARGTSVVPAGAFDYVPGDLLGHVAATALEGATELHVAYLVSAPGGPLSAGSAGTRRTVGGMLGRKVVSVVDGALRDETIMSERRLAWFPRPVGPHHAAGTGGAEPLTIPRHVTGLRTVRSYTAIPTWQAEASQLLGAAADRVPGVRKLVQRVISSGPEGPSERSRAATKMACVAEAATPGANPRITRAWMSGRDVYGFTAISMVLLAERILEGTAAPGVIAPAEVDAPPALLDELAIRADLRWSVITPSGS